MQKCHAPENRTHSLASRQQEGSEFGIIVEDDGSVVIVVEDPELVGDLEEMMDEIEAEELDDEYNDDDDFDDMGSVMLAGIVLDPQMVPLGGVNFTLDRIRYTAEFTCKTERGYCCMGGQTSEGLGVNCKSLDTMCLLTQQEAYI